MLFVHDLGKDQGPKGHCERGVELGKSLMVRLGISEETHDRVLFVVKNHLEMVRFANKFDLDDLIIYLLCSLQRENNASDSSMCTLIVMLNGTAPDLWNLLIKRNYTPTYLLKIGALERS